MLAPSSLCFRTMLPCRQDAWQVLFDPIGQSFNALSNLLPQWGETVFDVGRNNRVGLTHHKTISLQPLQGLGEHFFADPTDLPAQIAEAVRPSE